MVAVPPKSDEPQEMESGISWEWLTVKATSNLTNMADGIAILGTPVGSVQFMANFTLNKARKVKEILHKLSRLDDAQIALCLIRKCASVSRLNYLVRTVDTSSMTPAAEQFDHALH